MAKKITYWLLITLILSLGFGQLLRFDFYGLPLYLHDILVILIMASLLWRSMPSRTVLEGPGLKFFLLALLLSSLRALTLYPLYSLLVPALYSFRLLAYVALFFSLKNQKIKVPYTVFIISGIITIVIGLLQYFVLPDMRIFQYLGWDDHLSRLTLPHFDPTFTGVMLSLGLLSLPIARTYLLAPIFSLAILLTYSRSVWLSLVITGLMFIKDKRIILVSSILILISIYALPQRFGEGTNLMRTYSVYSRLDSDLAYVQKYKWDLIIGRGTNTLVLDAGPSHASGPNNSYLYILLTSGILGLIGWGTFMIWIYQNSSHKIMLAFFFIASIFNNVMFYPFSLLWVLLVEQQSEK